MKEELKHVSKDLLDIQERMLNLSNNDELTDKATDLIMRLTHKIFRVRTNLNELIDK